MKNKKNAKLLRQNILTFDCEEGECFKMDTCYETSHAWDLSYAEKRDIWKPINFVGYILTECDGAEDGVVNEYKPILDFVVPLLVNGTSIYKSDNLLMLYTASRIRLFFSDGVQLTIEYAGARFIIKESKHKINIDDVHEILSSL